MEYHYPDLCIPPDHHILNDPYAAEYRPQYLMSSREAEYSVHSNVLVDGGDRFGVSVVVFDKYEELVWMGNQGGHVTSYFGPGMQKYTSFQVHDTDEVRDILTVDKGIYVLTKTMLRHQVRRGIPRLSHRSQNMMNMQCLFQISPEKLLIGGHQNKLIEYDLNRLTESVIPISDDGCVIIRNGGGSLIACGSAEGIVSLRDIRCPGAVGQVFRAHGACLSDLDMQGDLLITCGLEESGGLTVAESCVMVWDVRRLRSGAPDAGRAVHIPAAPLLLHFLPAFSGRAVAVSGDGHATLLHVNMPSDTQNQSVFQVDTQNSLCSVMDVSTSSQALVFGDQNGRINLFTPQHNHEPIFNNHSRPTEFAIPVHLPFVNFADTSFRYSSIPLPPLQTGAQWFNYLPEEFYKKTYRKCKPIDPQVLQSMKMQGPIGYAPNPRTHRRNQMPYEEDTLEDLNAAKETDPQYSLQPIPKYYKRVDIRYNKHGICEDNDICNKTGYPGLEALMPNSYCNPMIQVMYHTPSVKAALLSHSCARENCLSYELGFLFRMLDASGGSPCQANNFLRAFRTVREAAALGLILPERGIDPRIDLVALIQSWSRFILHQIHYELLETRKKEKELAMMARRPSPPKPPRMLSMAPPQGVDASYEEFQYEDLQFLGPSEFYQEADMNRSGRDDRDVWVHPNQVECAGNSAVVPELPDPQPDDRDESDISLLFAIGRHQLNRCLKCNKEEERESIVLACALQYPTKTPRDGSDGRGFVDLIRASLMAKRSTPAWCDNCGRFTTTTQRGNVVRLPPILAINCGGVTAHEKAYWVKGHRDTAEAKPPRTGGGGKACRYGVHCARPGCRFKHPDRANPSHSSKTPSQSQCILPLQMLVKLQSDGDIIVTDRVDTPSRPSTPNRPESSKHKKKHVTTRSEEKYLLTAAIVCVEDNQKHLVAYIQTGGVNGSQWYLFNDLSIVPVNADEVAQFTAWWKTPCVLFYSSVKNMMMHERNT